MKLDNKTIEIWDKARDCKCSKAACEFNHKICGICGGTILYTAHESEQPNSKYTWNVDHIISKKNNGTNDVSNLQAVHIICNRQKD